MSSNGNGIQSSAGTRMMMSKRAMSIDNLSFTIREEDLRFNKENSVSNSKFDSKNCSQEALHKIEHDNRSSMASRQDNDEEERIIPWRAHLRKTNSRLSLIG